MRKDESVAVLVVNDNADQLLLKSTLLRQAGYQALTAFSGNEAYQLAQRNHPDLIISDVMMPNGTGIDLCRMIRSDQKLEMTPILLVSAMKKGTNSAVEGLEAGADDYLEVPFDTVHLIAKVTRLIERKRAEDALRERENRFKAIIQNVSDIISIVSSDGTIIYESPSAQTLLGYSHEELIERKIFDLVHPDDAEKIVEIFAATIQNFEQHQHSAEYRLKHKDGTWRIMEAVSKRMEDHQQGTVAIVVSRDITERKQMEEQMRQGQKMEAIGRLAGGIAHDFNNLLTIINGHSDLILLKLPPDDPIGRRAFEIKKAGERAAALTYQLLAFSRRQVLQFKVLDLNAVILDTVKMLNRLIGEDISLFTVLTPQVGKIKADPGQLSQVIINLTVNARDAMPDGGTLTIETNNVYLDKNFASKYVSVEPGNYVMLSFTDTGVGMDAETQKRIFEPFFTTKEVGQGTGLGLATVHGIVEQLGGKIWVYSEKEHGTTFKIYLPRVEADAEIEQAADVNNLPRGSETVLLVEDDEMVRGLTREILEMCGYRVLEAENGKQALLLTDETDAEIDLLLTDVVMPEMGGRNLARLLTEKYPGLKVLYASGYTDDAVIRHGIVEVGLHFIQKPFTAFNLAYKVRQIMDERRN